MPHNFHNTAVMEYGISPSVEPTIEPVTLAEMKNWLRIDHTSDDDLIDSLIESARVQAETLTRRSFINRTLIQTQADFPNGGHHHFHHRHSFNDSDRLILRASPVSSVTSVTFSDQAGDSQTLSSDNFRVVIDRPRPYIKLKTSFFWPLVEIDNDTAVQVTMIAGFGAAASDVADTVKTAIKMGVAFKYENRGDSQRNINDEQFNRIIKEALGPVWIVEF